VQSTGTPGEIRVTAIGQGLRSGSLAILAL
jgi:hypothetical protein